MPSMKVTKIAEICYEACRQVDIAAGREPLPDWKTAGKDAYCPSVDRAAACLCYPNTSAEDWHNDQVAKLMELGWKYGSVKDSEKLIDPRILPFKQLPSHVQAKENLFKLLCDELRYLVE